MKKLITAILILFLSYNAAAQTPSIDTLYVVDTLARDTIPVLIPALDTSHYYDVYRYNGSLKQHNADVYYLIPSGGWRIRLGLISNTRKYIEGYEVYKTRTDYNMELVESLDAFKEPIKAPYIKVGAGIPIAGL
jgi:hypothetical protein